MASNAAKLPRRGASALLKVISTSGRDGAESVAGARGDGRPLSGVGRSARNNALRHGTPLRVRPSGNAARATSPSFIQLEVCLSQAARRGLSPSKQPDTKRVSAKSRVRLLRPAMNLAMNLAVKDAHPAPSLSVVPRCGSPFQRRLRQWCECYKFRQTRTNTHSEIV